MNKFMTSPMTGIGLTGRIGNFWVFVSALMIFAFFISAADARPGWCRNVHYNSPATEKTVCDNPSLWNLDDALNVAYRRARYDSPRQSRSIKRSQRRWLRKRNRCRASVSCLNRVYNNRIYYLEGFYN